MIKNVCVYCGHHSSDVVYQQSAQDFGRLLGQSGMNLVYGGGKLGLMGMAATAALDEGGYVIGYIPEYLDQFEGAHMGIQELHRVDSMHERKQAMFDKADAFVVLPGGFGTLDEFFEIMTWRQLRLHEKPIIIVNVNGYWSKLVDLLNYVVDCNFASPEHRTIFSVVDSVDEAMNLLGSCPQQDHKKPSITHLL